MPWPSATGFATAATTLPLIMTPAPLLHASRGGGVDVVRRPHSSPHGTAAGLLRNGRVRTKKFSTSPLSLIERCAGSSSASYTSSSHIPVSTVRVPIRLRSPAPARLRHRVASLVQQPVIEE